MQNPDAPVFHPSRDEGARTKMLDNLTKFLSKQQETMEKSRGIGSFSETSFPAGWRSIDPRDHMGSIMN